MPSNTSTCWDSTSWPPKWHELRIPYPLENQKGPNAATRERVTNQFKDHGFTVY